MTVKLRLARGGSKKDPHYTIVAIDSRKAREGKAIEKLGSYHPRFAKDNPERVILKKEKINHWLSVGAEPTQITAKLFIQGGIEAAAKFKKEHVKHKYTGISKEEVKKLKEEESKAAAAASKVSGS